MLRRNFLTSCSLCLGLAALRSRYAWPQQGSKSILDYGARPDRKRLNTGAIQRAIDEVANSGGGTVHVPVGTFLTGRLDLKSHVTLYLDRGAVLLGSTSLGDYQGSEGDSDRSQRHMIFARDAVEVSLAGPGQIDGQGPSFWEPSGKAPLAADQAWADVASHAMKPKSSGRPSPMVLFANCRGVRIHDVTLQNSPGWTLHTLNCDDVEISGITINNPVYGPNTDGIDVTCSQNVTITGCSIETGDDAICLKSESPAGEEPRLVKNVTVTNCTLTTCCNGFKLGTSSEGGFENIVFTGSTVTNKPVSLGQRVISGVALEVIDGGWIDGVRVSGIRMERTRTPIFIRLGNRKRVHNYAQHGLRNVVIENVQAMETVLASSITGIPGDNVDGISLSNVTIENVLRSRPDSNGNAVPEKESAYPEARMFGMLPVSGLYVRHAQNLHFDHVAITAAHGESRPTLMFDDVDNVNIRDLKSTSVNGDAPVVSLMDARDVTIANSVAPSETHTFLSVSGATRPILCWQATT